MTDKRQKAIKVKCKCNEFTTKLKIKNNGTYIFFFRRSIWFLLKLVHRRTQNFNIIDQEKHKIEQINIWNTITTRLIYYLNIVLYIISMEFLLIRHIICLSCKMSLAVRSKNRWPYSKVMWTEKTFKLYDNIHQPLKFLILEHTKVRQFHSDFKA